MSIYMDLVPIVKAKQPLPAEQSSPVSDLTYYALSFVRNARNAGTLLDEQARLISADIRTASEKLENLDHDRLELYRNEQQRLLRSSELTCTLCKMAPNSSDKELLLIACQAIDVILGTPMTLPQISKRYKGDDTG